MSASVASSLRADARWRPWEIALFAALALSWWVLPGQSLLLSEIAIVALFAVSLDLILGYAGIVSLGHAAFFGFGAYGAALFAKHVMPTRWSAWRSRSRSRRCSARRPAC
jgi:branched-chain amino acid transport system permease protein